MSIALYFIVLAAFSVIFTLEVIAPASGATCDKRWQFYAGGLSLLQVGSAIGAGILFDDFFRAHALLSLPASLPAPVLNALCAYLIFGLSATAAAWGLLYVALDNLFMHMDLRTPHWLGALVQRPEMHRVHHKRNFHAQNYGLPIWDLAFGTFDNPRERVVECGFRPEAEYLVKDMLLMKKLDA